jgi:hypothetical protein
MAQQHEGRSLGAYRAAEEIPAHSIVKIDASKLMSLADAEERAIGVVHEDVAVDKTGSPVPFYRYSSHILRAIQGITPGTIIDQAADGRVQPSTTSSFGVGVALSGTNTAGYIEVTWVNDV